MNDHSRFPTLTLLIHAKMAAFEWGKVAINSFRRHAARNKFTVRSVYHWQEVSYADPLVILIGVDESWLNEALENLDPQQQRIVLLYDNQSRRHERISRVLEGQEVLVKECLQLLARRGRTRPAFFGVQQNDVSDEAKAAEFARLISPKDVYCVVDQLDNCFHQFITHLDRYDSVICANDIMAVYLLGRCREQNIPVPERLMMIGNGNLWLGAHVTPALTTISYDADAMASVTVQLCKNLLIHNNLAAVDIRLAGDLLERGSTGGTPGEQKIFTSGRDLYRCTTCQEILPEIDRIRSIDRVLSACSSTQKAILQLLAEGRSYGSIAETVGLSCDAVKYHVKKLYKHLEIHSKDELASLFRYYGICL